MGIGVIFAATVINPNYLMRRSWYMRKVQLALWGTVGWNVGHKYYGDNYTYMWIKMHDYFPVEVKRAMRDKDFRHLALFDLEQALKERKVFDDVTGKSLS